MRIVLLGDSHLARVRLDLDRVRPVGATVTNLAMGGAFASDLAAQASAAGLAPADRVVVSVGTNDAAPWKRVDPDRALEHVRDFLTTYAAGLDRLVFLASPGVDESRAAQRTNAELGECAASFGRAFVQAGARVVDAAALLAPLGGAAFVEDGVHLSGDGYDVLLPVVRTSLE